MDHAAGVAAGAEGNVVAFEERDLQPAQAGVTRDAHAVDSATDHDHVAIERAAARIDVEVARHGFIDSAPNALGKASQSLSLVSDWLAGRAGAGNLAQDSLQG